MKKLILKENIMIFIEKKSKSFIHVQLNKINEKIEIIVYKSSDGINLEPAEIDEPVVDSLPTTTGDIIADSLSIIRHFKAYGYKEINTLTLTNSSIKFS